MLHFFANTKEMISYVVNTSHGNNCVHWKFKISEIAYCCNIVNHTLTVKILTTMLYTSIYIFFFVSVEVLV